VAVVLEDQVLLVQPKELMVQIQFLVRSHLLVVVEVEEMTQINLVPQEVQVAEELMVEQVAQEIRLQ
jgi:hypothetical protein